MIIYIFNFFFPSPFISSMLSSHSVTTLLSMSLSALSFGKKYLNPLKFVQICFTDHHKVNLGKCTMCIQNFKGVFFNCMLHSINDNQVMVAAVNCVAQIFYMPVLFSPAFSFYFWSANFYFIKFEDVLLGAIQSYYIFQMD